MDSDLKSIADSMRNLHGKFEAYSSGGPQPDLTDAMKATTAALATIAETVNGISEFLRR